MTAAPSSAARELDQDAPTDTTRMIFCVSTGSEAAFLRGLGLAAGTADIDKLDAFRGILAAVVPQDESAAAVNKAAGFAIRLRDSAAKIVRSPWTIYDFKAAADEELDLADFLAEIGRNDFPEWTPQDAEQEIKNAEEFSRALAAGDEPEPWEPPIPLVGAAELPAFPVEDLPPLVRGFVSSVAKSRQTPVDLPGVLALGILSGGVARKFIVKIGDTHTDPTNIYTCVGMNTGERKSPVFDDMAGPYEEYERETAKGKRASLLVLAERRQIQEHRLKALRARAAKDDGPDATKAQEEAETLAASMDDVPHPPRFIVRDSTPEALSQVLETSGGKITVLQPEGGGLFDILAGRYSGKANFDVWLHGYSEEELRIDRKGSPPVFVPRASITAVLTTQPEVIEKLSSIDGARGRGLLARFLYSMPKSNVGYRPYKNLQIDPSERAIYRAAVREILAISDPSKQQNGDDGEPYVLRVEGESLDATAGERWTHPLPVIGPT